MNPSSQQNLAHNRTNQARHHSSGRSLDGVRFFDSHCHVHDERIPDGPAGAIDDALAAGVERMVTVGCDRTTSLAALALAAEHDAVLATVGLHPHDAKAGIDTITDLFDRPGVAAIGEAGLDYYYDHSDRAAQRAVFAAQIQISHERSLPLIIHTRDAWDDTFDILDAEGTPEQTVFHCFTGGPDEARRCLNVGASISFSGIVTFKNAADVQRAAQLTPLDAMLIETDAPYLAPTPHRGQSNRPAWVVDVARCLADLTDRSIAELSEATFTNATRIFLPARSGEAGDTPS